MVILSYSTIKLLRSDPQEYHRIYIQGGEKNKPTNRQVDGMLAHDLLFSPNVVPDKYFNIPKIPSSSMMRKYLDCLSGYVNGYFKIADDMSEDVLKALQEKAHAASGYEENLVSVIKKAQEFQEYFNYSLIKDNKVGIEPGQPERIVSLLSDCQRFLDVEFKLGAHDKRYEASKGMFRKLVQQSHDQAKNIITKKYEIYWEFPFHIVMPLNSKTTGKRTNIAIHGYYDYLNADHVKKVVYIKDLKKVEDILQFKDNFEKRMLDIQAGVYLIAMKEFIKRNYPDYAVKISFCVIDDSGKNYNFELSEETVKKVIQKTEKAIDIAFFHLSLNVYALPYEYLKKQILL